MAFLDITDGLVINIRYQSAVTCPVWDSGFIEETANGPAQAILSNSIILPMMLPEPSSAFYTRNQLKKQKRSSTLTRSVRFVAVTETLCGLWYIDLLTKPLIIFFTYTVYAGTVSLKSRLPKDRLLHSRTMGTI